MSALTEMTQPTRIPSAGNMMRSFMGAARSLPSDSNVPSVSQYYKLQDQVYCFRLSLILYSVVAASCVLQHLLTAPAVDVTLLLYPDLGLSSRLGPVTTRLRAVAELMAM